MDIKMLQSRNLNDCIKKGMTMGDFCEKYECSEEELIAQIGNLYSRNPSKAKEQISRIEANAKKARLPRTGLLLLNRCQVLKL